MLKWRKHIRAHGTILSSQNQIKALKLFQEHESFKTDTFPLKASLHKEFRSGTSIWTILTSGPEQEFQMFEHYGH